MIRAEFIFPEYEITICSCYVNSVKSTELHVTRGLKQAGKAEATSNGIVVQQILAKHRPEECPGRQCIMDKAFFFFLNVKRHPLYPAHHKACLH